MKDSHIYQRLTNPSVVKTYIHMINTYELETVNDLFNNITKQADDHPRYTAILEAYNNRIKTI
jgi:hypothetical protein